MAESRGKNKNLVEAGNPRLLKKLVKNDTEYSLYLEYQMGYNRDNGTSIRKKESLSLYLLASPRTPIQRQQNKETLELAKKIRFEREQEFLDNREGYRLKKDVLSQEEIQKLMDTHYQFEKENVRNAFIFCLYTGMRFCDVKDLRYSNIDYANKLLRFEQDKTKGHSARSWVTIPLNDGLIHLVGMPKEGETKESLVFNLPSYESCCKSVKR